MFINRCVTRPLRCHRDSPIAYCHNVVLVSRLLRYMYTLSSDFIFLSSNRVGLTCIMQVQIFALLVFTQILSILKRRCQLQLTVNIWPMGVSRGFRVQTPRNESVPEIRYKSIKISRQSMGMEVPKPRNVFLATPLVWPVRLGKCRAYSVKYCTLCDLSVP